MTIAIQRFFSLAQGKRVRRTVNYGDAAAGGKEMDDGSWQDNLSDYNSDFSMPSDQEDGNNIYFFKLHFNPICHGRGVLLLSPFGFGDSQ